MEKQTFRTELEKLINRYCMENGSNTPDFILAEYLIQSIIAFDAAVKVRSAWYGGKDKIPSPEITE